MGLDFEQLKSAVSGKWGDRVEAVVPENGESCFKVPPELWHDFATWLRDDPELKFDYLMCLSGVDWPERSVISSVTHLHSMTHRHRIAVHVEMDRENPKTASVADLWPAADWHEREAYDLYGIIYEGHPELKRILLPDDWVGYPMRKDYKPEKFWRGMKIETEH